MPVPDAVGGHVAQDDAENQLPSAKPKTVHILLGFFFMLNVLLCSGYPGIPFVFYQAGILVAAVTLILVIFIGWNCAIWMVEVMARAQGVTLFWEWKKHQQQSTRSLQDSVVPGPDYTILITRKFEPSELCEIFFGRWCKYLYLITLVLFTLLCLPGYATLAGSSWAVNLPLNFTGMKECSEEDFSGHILPVVLTCRHSYWFCLMLFAIIVVSLSLVEAKNQMFIQVLFGFLRFVLLGSMIVYCFVQLVWEHGHQSCVPDGDIIDDPSNLTDSDCNVSTGTINSSSLSSADIVLRTDLQGWLESIPIFVFSILLHQGIPNLTHPVRQKKYLRGYFNAVFATVGFIYLSIGILATLWFKDSVNETVTLDWDATTKTGPMAIRVLSYYISLFPSLDVCSVYPLIVMTMVNNLYTVLFGKDSSECCDRRHFIILVVMRLVGAIIPILAAMWISNLHYILNYAGLIGFFICFFFPTALQLGSQWVCKKTFTKKNGIFPAPSVPATPESSIRSQFRSTQTNIFEESYCHVSEDGSTYDEVFDQSLLPEDAVVSPFGDPYLSIEKSLLMSSEHSVMCSSTETTPLLSSAVSMVTKVSPPPVYQTPYSTKLSHPVSVVLIGLLGFGCFCLSLSNIFLHVF